MHHGGIGDEEPDDGLGKEEADSGDKNGVEEFQLQAAEEAGADTLFFARAAVLGHQGGGGMADVLLGHIGKVIDAACSGKGCHGVDTHGVHDGLNGDLAQLNGGLLHGAGPAVADGLFQQRGVKNEPAPAQLQHRNFPADIDQAEHAAERFAQHGGKGTTLGAPIQHLNKEQVAADVQYRTDHQEVQRAFAVAQRTHGGGEEIIEEGEQQPTEHDAQVVHSDGKDLFRHLQQTEQRICQDHTGQREHQGKDGACNGGGGDLTLHQPGVACPERRADKDACTQADTVDEQNRQRHQRVGGAHGGKGILAHEFADNDAVHGVIGQLEQVAQHEGDRKIDQQRCDRAGRHILGHMEFSFLKSIVCSPTVSFPTQVNTGCGSQHLLRALALASCWPRPQQQLPVSATGGGRCCCRPFHYPSGHLLWETPRRPAKNNIKNLNFAVR